MNVAEIFVRRPVMTTLVMVGVLVFGIVGYRNLPVASLPNVDFPTISVSASLPGASPETMASAVATPLEKRFSTIPAVDSMTSTSSLGSTSITIQFSLDRDIDAAAPDVQAAISSALRQHRFRVAVHLRQRQGLRGQGEEQHREIGRIALVVRRRRRHAFRQAARRARDRRLHVLRGGVDVAIEIEGQRDARVSLAAARACSRRIRRASTGAASST
jgi:hypothetical protein